MTIQLRTPSENGTPFEFDVESREIVIISQNGNEFRYQLSAIRDLYNWLMQNQNGNWVLLGTKNENEIPNAGTVEEWARSPNNPVNGFYGVTPGNRGRFASFIPPVLEAMGLAEVQHNPNNNSMRSL